MNKDKFEVRAEVKVVLTQQDIDDIMVSALEGGITYWADKAVVDGEYLGEYASDQISRGGKLKIHTEEPFDDDDTEWYELDRDKFLKGVSLWLANGGAGCLEGDKLDVCMVDGLAADSIVQYALFGEEVYA